MTIRTETHFYSHSERIVDVAVFPPKKRKKKKENGFTYIFFLFAEPDRLIMVISSIKAVNGSTRKQ